MASLKSNNSRDGICYTLDLENSSALCQVTSVEILQNNLVLISTMLERLGDDDIERVAIHFKSRGGRYIEKTIEAEVEPVIEKDNEEEDGKGKRKKKTLAHKVKEWKWNNVCFIPAQLDVVLDSRSTKGNCVYSIAVQDFMRFYKANLDTIINRDIMDSQSLVNKPDANGFTLVRNVKRDKSKFCHAIETSIANMSHKVRTKCKDEMNQIYSERKQYNKKKYENKVGKNLNDILDKVPKGDLDDETDKVSDLELELENAT